MEHVAERPAVEPVAGDGKSREKQLTRASSSDSDEMYSAGSPKEILKSGGKTIAPTGEADIIYIPHVMDKTLILNRNNSNKNNNNPTPPSTVSLLDVGGGGGAVAEVVYRKPFEDEQELHLQLQTLYNLPNSHNFYCPNCKSCITKVIILRDAPRSLSPPPRSGSKDGAYHELPPSTNIPTETRPQSPRRDAGEIAVDDGRIISSEEGGGRIICSNCFSFLLPIGAWISSQLGFGKKKLAIPADRATTGGTDATSPAGSSSIISREPIVEVEAGGSVAVTIPATYGEETLGSKVTGGRSLEIMKSIVYGGLTEAITSLGIVTSAASASTPTENIVALALANLITGLIVITNNLSGLKSNQLKKESNERVDQAKVDPYEEALGDRHHYILHFTTAIISFLLFGLLPPLVYGFSFRDTDDSDLKLAAVAVSSLLCIALLAIMKAYVQKANKWQEFAKTLLYYITLGFGASGLSYLAGKEFDMLLEQLGWFKKDPVTPTLLLPNMDFAKPTWGSI
ncbi:unnamed protein product [Citrullus colocynthis]|uniref:Membrane protein of ER body-like protein n=1 Tax=Citrullus colocynthis TaxID=252529 RepID=A0ABP0XSW0_9ROSI